MDVLRRAGFKCSTFDLGNIPSNDDPICCQVGDWFNKSGWNDGSTVSAIRFIQGKGSATWYDFVTWVESHGGFLSDSLRLQVKQLWNGEGNDAYSPLWGAGIEAEGVEDGSLELVYRPDKDFRRDLFNQLQTEI